MFNMQLQSFKLRKYQGSVIRLDFWVNHKASLGKTQLV